MHFRKNLGDAQVDKDMQSRLNGVLDLASSEGVTGYQLSPAVYALRDKKNRVMHIFSEKVFFGTTSSILI